MALSLGLRWAWRQTKPMGLRAVMKARGGANGGDCSYKAIGSDGKPLRRQRDMDTESKALKDNFLRALGAME